LDTASPACLLLPATLNDWRHLGSFDRALLLQHLLDRVQERRIDAKQLELLAAWLDGEREVPKGSWYERFTEMTVCSEGELIKTFLLPGQAPKGERVR
jgi:hypothetical protein